MICQLLAKLLLFYHTFAFVCRDTASHLHGVCKAKYFDTTKTHLIKLRGGSINGVSLFSLSLRKLSTISSETKRFSSVCEREGAARALSLAWRIVLARVEREREETVKFGQVYAVLLDMSHQMLIKLLISSGMPSATHYVAHEDRRDEISFSSHISRAFSLHCLSFSSSRLNLLVCSTVGVTFPREGKCQVYNTLRKREWRLAFFRFSLALFVWCTVARLSFIWVSLYRCTVSINIAA